MTHDELADASDALKDASEAAATDELREHLHERSDALATLASKDRKPDHGRLAREDGVLRDVLDDNDVNEDVSEHVETAREKIREFREDLPGV
ncbi:hypothetical protein SAMN06269185_2492 [Natronoarchaeum philippinense]|uniref:Uncharacterized protein n=1 Tax=Natronoarchaeum philippinense TaxID=558529 RepID=A0A285P6F5_NATPI|nr:hypothetical protein [Natronoarchaeum philippinense]SNZ15461.1 hypothetical protein SAMN06269185_2492 [Natronoarchaeum philippinense]